MGRVGDWSAPGTGEAMGWDGPRLSAQSRSVLQQESLQLDRLKTPLSDAVQRYGWVQKVRLPGRACGPARALQFPPNRLAPGLAWVGLVGVLSSRAEGGQGLQTAARRQLPQPQDMCWEGTRLWVLLRGPLGGGESGHPPSDS